MNRKYKGSSIFKILVVLCLMLFLLVTLIGCSSSADQDSITGIWQGSWEYQGNSFSSTIELTDDGKYVQEIYKNGESLSPESGTYEIKGNTVTLHKDGDSRINMNFKYSKGKLSSDNQTYLKQ